MKVVIFESSQLIICQLGTGLVAWEWSFGKCYMNMHGVSLTTICWGLTRALGIIVGGLWTGSKLLELRQQLCMLFVYMRWHAKHVDSICKRTDFMWVWVVTDMNLKPYWWVFSWERVACNCEFPNLCHATVYWKIQVDKQEHRWT